MLSDILQQIKKYSRYLINNAFYCSILSDILQQIKKYLKYLINNAFCYICLNFCVDRCTSSYIYKTVTEVILVSRNCQTMLSDILQQIKKYSRYLINNAFYQIYCRTVTELILVLRNCLLHNAFRHPSVDQEILQRMSLTHTFFQICLHCSVDTNITSCLTMLSKKQVSKNCLLLNTSFSR